MTRLGEPFRVEFERGSFAAEFDPAPTSGGDLLICAHGAGGQLADRGVLALSEAFRSAGLDVVRFNFLYRERGSARPDTMPLLRATYGALLAEVRRRYAPRRCFLGGRSLGGRTATMLAADGIAADGVVPVAYPLHPPGQPEKLRVEHLRQITLPVLCFSGTRDEFCTPDLMRAATLPLPAWTQHWLEGADHSLHVLKRSGRNDEQVLAEVAEATRTWLQALPRVAAALDR